MSVASQTLRALAAPRRAIPLALVIASVLIAEASATADPRAVLIDLALSVAFCVVLPAAWRRLCGASRSATPGQNRERATSALDRVLGLFFYLSIVGIIIGGLGFLLPAALSVPTYVTHPSALGVLFAVFAVAGWGLGRDIEMEADLSAERVRAERLAIESERAQLLALKAQLDPHFLFNTLNAIAEWCREDPEVAERATLELAGILRTILEGAQEPTWSLAREIALLRDLFGMYEIRDDQRYRLELSLPEVIPDIEVPSMILLPIFENAITHGPGAGHEGPVRLALTTTGDQLRVEIRNSGPLGPRREGGQGIISVERRLALSHGERAQLRLREEGGETLSILSLPISEQLA